MFRSNQTRVIALDPADPTALFMIGNDFLHGGNAQQAIIFYNRLVTQNHSLDGGHLNLAIALSRIGSFDASLVHAKKSQCLAPGNEIAYLNAWEALKRTRAFKEAAINLQRVSAISPMTHSAQLNRALCLFLLGDIRSAWPLYERRFDVKNSLTGEKNVSRLISGKPVYDRERKSHRVLVWAEQGVGDEVMFGSMLGEFRGHVGKLLVQLDRRLIPLFKRSLPDDVEFFERGTVVPEDRYDSHIAIGSLGQYLRPTLESFEGKGGKYLWADPERIQVMREWLSVKEGERVIGLSWRSSNPETGAARSLALKDLVKSLQAPGVRFVNLQYGDVSAEIEALEREEGIRVLECPGLDTTDDLDGLAALIEACDEIVSIGNATAHLAGALGKKTTVLLPKAPSWRWLADGGRSPWYVEASLKRDFAV